jgi:hypothetical protein
MIRTERLTAATEDFASERKAILTRTEERIRDAVRASLIRIGLGGWTENAVEAAADVFDETASFESDEWGPVLDDLRAEFIREVTAALEKTKPVSAEDREGQLNTVTRWLSAAAVNAGTEAAATADPDGSVGLEWITMGDENVRSMHEDVNGQTVPSGQAFSVGGEELLYPGQPVGAPEVWMNCRCVARPTMLGELTTRTITAAAPVPEEEPDGRPSEEPPAEEPTPEDIESLEENSYPEIPWHGVLAPEGKPSGDGRKFADGALSHRPLPISMKYMWEDDEGHMGSYPVARIDRIVRRDGMVWGEGVFDTSPAAYEAVRVIANGIMTGVSVDVDAAVAAMSEDDAEAIEFTSARISAATICAIPAFAEAFIALGPLPEEAEGEEVPEEDEVPEDAVPAGTEEEPDEEQPLPPKRLASDTEEFDIPPRKTKDGPGWITDPKPTKQITSYWVDGPGAAKIGWGAPGDFNRCRTQLVKYVQNPDWLAGLCANLHYRALNAWPGQAAGRTEEMNQNITASVTLAEAETRTLPADWFKDPQLPFATPLTVTNEGRIFGHIADWQTCHISVGSNPNECVLAPHSATSYAYFLTGEVDTDQGAVPVGQITMGGGHADLRSGVRAAIAHYDSTSTAVADVTVGEDEHGIWFAGALREDLTPQQLRELKAASLSGDWRGVRRTSGGVQRELVAALAVNVPGFPIPRTSFATQGTEVMALVAAGIPERSPNIDELVEAALVRRERKAKLQKARAESNKFRLARARALVTTH